MAPKRNDMFLFIVYLFILSQGLISEVQCQQTSVNGTRSSQSVNSVNNFSLFHLDLDVEIPANLTMTLDCEALENPSTSDIRVLHFNSCDPHKILNENKLLPQIIANSSNVFMIFFEVDTKLKEMKEQVVENFRNLHRSVLVTIQSTHDNSSVVFTIEKGRVNGEFLEKWQGLGFFIETRLKSALKRNCALCLRLLYISDSTKYSKELKIANNDKNQRCDIECFRALLNVPFDFDFSDVTDTVRSFLHDKYVKGLKDYTQKTARINENYTQHDFMEENSRFAMNLAGITSMAWSQGQFRVVEFLIRADCFYPHDIADHFESHLEELLEKPKPNRYLRKLHEHMTALKNFHNAIASDDTTEVENFVLSHPNVIFARDGFNKSALYVASENQRFEVYAKLKARGFLFGDLRELAQHYEDVENLPYTEKEKIRQFNYRHLTSLSSNLSYIEKLIEKTRINSSKAHNHEKLARLVREAYVEVNELASELLELTAQSEELVIVFDFDYAVADEFNPGLNAVGVTVRQYNFVLVAAANLLSEDEEERNYALGTIAHELMHFAMYLIYDNEARPYKIDDREMREKFTKITEDAKEKEDYESFWAYDESNEDFHIELIARVPDILLNHKHNATRIETLRREFEGLIDFYENVVVPDIKRLTPTMSAREKIRDINLWFDALRLINNTLVKIDMGECEEIEEGVVDAGEDPERENSEQSNENEGQLNEVNVDDVDDMQLFDKLQMAEDDDEGYKTAEDENSDENRVDSTLKKVAKVRKINRLGGKNDQQKALKTERKNKNKLQNRLSSKKTQKSKPKNSKIQFLTKSTDVATKESHKRFKRQEDHNTDDNQSEQDFNALLNFTLETSESQKFKVIFTNYPVAIENLILKRVRRDDLLAVFTKLSSLTFDNILTTFHTIDNLNEDIIVFIDCDEMDNLSEFLDMLKATILKNIVFIALSEHAEKFNDEDQFEKQEFNVYWRHLCSKSREVFLDLTFQLQDDEITLRDLVGGSKLDDLDFLPLLKFDDSTVEAYGVGSLGTNEEYLIERKLIDEEGKSYRLRDFVNDFVGLLEYSSKKRSLLVVLSDLPESGKTTALKQIALEIRKKSPSTWVVKIDLESVAEDSSLLDATFADRTEFDVEMLKLLLNESVVAFVFDNFSGTKQQLKLIAEARKYARQIWVETEPQHANVLKSKFNGAVVKFDELDRNDLRHLLEHFSEEHEEQLIELIEATSVRHFGTIRAITEVAETLGDASNAYRIFSHVLLAKNFEEEEKSVDDISAALESPLEVLKIHQEIALHHLLGQKSTKSSEKLQRLLQFKLVSLRENHKVMFTEKAIANFLAAQYIIDNALKIEASDATTRTVTQLKKRKETWKNLKRFIVGYLEINENKLDKKRVEKIKDIIRDGE